MRNVQAFSKATRRSDRIRGAVREPPKPQKDIEKQVQTITKQEKYPNHQQAQEEGIKSRKRIREAVNLPIEQPKGKRLRTKEPSRTKPREHVENLKQFREDGQLLQKPDPKRKWTQEKPPQKELSEKNLRIWEMMDETASHTRSGNIKRSSSRRSVTDTTQETSRSQRSSGSLALYRFTHLANVKVYIHVEPSKDIQYAIDAIIKAELPKGRRDQLKSVSQAFSQGCTEAARAAVGEDDFVRHFRTALQTIQPENLCFREKADWDEGLKPNVPQFDFNLDFLTNSDFAGLNEDHEVGNTANPPPMKRLAYMSPKSSTPNASASAPQGSITMAPPPRPDYIPLIKTPRPDLSIGTKLDALTSAFSSQGLSSTQAKMFLTQLQSQMIAREPRMVLEPALISVPAPRASDLAFPFAVVEGKAYSTGKQVFEAENQAAVSGACGLKIQLCLNELVRRATGSPNSQFAHPEYHPPIFFSICTEGPLHELWAHWTCVEEGVRKFNMTLLKHCHGVLLESVEDFMIAVDNILRWGTGQFVDSVVERLGKIAMKAKNRSMITK